jgi:UDP-3-O-acyl N-acetylglucosamine deacetylase
MRIELLMDEGLESCPSSAQVKDDVLVKRISYRYQRTIAHPAEVEGVGFLTGATVRLGFLPAPASTGIIFRRMDLKPAAEIPALVTNVAGTKRRTILGLGSAQIGLVEHVLAALAGLRIDNCYVELNAPEPPGLDGSSQGFVEALKGAGVVLQASRRPVYTVESPVQVAQEGATLAYYPGKTDELKISYTLHYGPGLPIGRQTRTQMVTPEHFAAEIAACRTFIFESEAEELRRQGLGARTTFADLLVFGPDGPISNTLRYADEPARHKILDLIGDLALFGHDLRGHLVAYRSGHALNVELVRQLEQQRGATPCVRRRSA